MSYQSDMVMPVSETEAIVLPDFVHENIVGNPLDYSSCAHVLNPQRRRGRC